MSPPDSAHLHNVHRTSAPLAASWWKPDKTWRPRKNKCNRIKWPLRHSGEHQGRATWPPSSSCSFSKNIKFNSIGHQRNVEMNSINRRHCHHSLELIRLIILSVERWLNLHTSPAVNKQQSCSVHSFAMQRSSQRYYNSSDYSRTFNSKVHVDCWPKMAAYWTESTNKSSNHDFV